MGIPALLTCLLWNLYACQEARVKIRHGTANCCKIGKGVHQGCILSPCSFIFYAEYIMQNARLDEAKAGIKIAGRNVNNLRYEDDTTLIAESKEELKSLLMKVKEENEKAGLKLNIQKMKKMAPGPITSWQMGKQWQTSFYWAPKSLQMVNAITKLKDICSWKKSYHKPSSVQFSCSVMSDSLWPHEPQHTRPPCPSPTPGVYPNLCPLSRWCHLTISSSVVPFSSCLRSFSASGSFQMSQLFTSGGQNIGVSAATSVLPMNTQDWFPLGWTDWISLQSKRLSRVFSNTTVQKHQFFCTQLSL